MNNTDPSLTCDHTEENGVHTLTFYDNDMASIRQFFIHMENIYADVSADDALRFLVDINASGGPLPLWKAFAEGQKWARGLRVHPAARMAFVYYPTPIISLSDTLFKTTGWGHLETALFRGDEPDAHEQALTWLLRPW